MRDNINSLITLFAYTTIVLSAMQVGLATEPLANDHSFGMASYVFSIFSILAPLACIVAILGVIAMMFVINLARTLRIRRQKRRQGVKV
jgi:L-asparagine transporter-like permease